MKWVQSLPIPAPNLPNQHKLANFIHIRFPVPIPLKFRTCTCTLQTAMQFPKRYDPGVSVG